MVVSWGFKGSFTIPNLAVFRTRDILIVNSKAPNPEKVRRPIIDTVSIGTRLLSY